MKKTVLIILLLVPATAWSLTADQIINRVDRNQTSVTQRYRATMTIKKGRRILIKKMWGYGRGNGEKSYIHFTNREDRGVKYLKLNKELWIYFPDADDTMKISGHMLRQGMMGSDISYEDMMETEAMRTLYRAKRKNDGTIRGRACYILDLTAKVSRAHYARQVLYVDKATWVPLKIEMYARGGRMVKRVTQERIKRIGYRNVPMKMTIKDTRKRNSSTTIIFSRISFNVALPRRAFSKGRLRR